MHGTESKLIKFMGGSTTHFIIPVYQRNYDWQKENCRQLYDDLIKVIRQKRPSHFFGSIVSASNDNGAISEHLIIDGQQRLTTVSLLLLAMHHLLQQGKVVSSDTRLSDKILKQYLIDEYEQDEKRIKLKTVKNDKAAFGRLFDDQDAAIPDSNLTLNYKYFYERIQLKEITIDELFDAICRLEIISITLNHEDNPQLIFESLNSTGMDLAEGDKIRNFILMGLPIKIQSAYYDKYWNRIERCTAYDVSSFMRDYLSVKQQRTPNIKAVYVVFKEYAEPQCPNNVEEILKELLAYAKRYELLIKHNSEDDVLNGCIYRLNRLSTTVVRPFLLEVLRLADEKRLSAQDVREIFQITEAYLFRRAICDVPTNALNKIFLLLHREITRIDGTDADYVEKFKYVLTHKRESGLYPTDTQFTDCLSTKDVYMMTSKNKLYLFERLENHGTVETKDVWAHLDKGEYSIEHIMPQHLTREWVEALGEDYEIIHATWKHRLANLTLTGYNSKYSNLPFHVKRDMKDGFKSSGLRMNQWIGQQEQWTEAEIKARNTALLQRAVQIWGYPTTTYAPPEKLMDSVSLEEDAVLTGRSLAKYSFLGVEQPAASWVDMYQQVITALHNKNKAILTHLATVEDNSAELSSQFYSKPIPSTKQIDENVYVWTGIDTQYKQTVLRKLFAMFDISESELIFYLKDDQADQTDDDPGDKVVREYWQTALPDMRAVFHNEGPFANVSPSSNYWVDGYIGFAGIHLCCSANNNGAHAELYIGKPDKDDNKAVFDYLLAHKVQAEAQAACSFIWNRMDDKKASKIGLAITDVAIHDEATWPKMRKFHCDGIAKLYDAFVPLLKAYYQQ